MGTSPVAVCEFARQCRVHVHELFEGGCFTRELMDFDHVALYTRDTFQVSCGALHVALGGIKDLSCCFLHAVLDVWTILAHVQQLSHGCPVHGSFLVLQLDQRLLSLAFS